MNFAYIILSSLLSFALVTIGYFFVSRAEKIADIFSVALGIIIFGCMKGMFVECGWGFAALFGIKTGIAVQVVLFSASVLFFHALMIENENALRQNRVPRIVALGCFGFGKGMLRNYATFYSPQVYILGEAADFALASLSLNVLNDELSDKSFSLVGETAIILLAKAIVLIIYRNISQEENSFAALILLVMGIAGFICQFARAMGERQNISVVGFAIGVTISFCVNSLEG